MTPKMTSGTVIMSHFSPTSYDDLVAAMNTRADGVIFLGQSFLHQSLNRLAETDGRFVVWGAQMPDQLYCSVGSDNLAGGRRATLHLARLGRSNDEIVGEDSARLFLTRRDDRLPLAVSGNLAVHGAAPAPSDQLWIWGARGTIHLDGTVLRLMGPEPREVRFDPEQSYQAAYDGAIAHFAAGLAHGPRFETAAADNLNTLALVEAAYRISGFQPKAAI